MRAASFWGLAGRWLLLVWGMLVATAGIVFITRAGLGTTPISTVPFTVGEITGLTFGEATFAVNILFVFVQWALLRSRFHYSSFFQIPIVSVFSWFIDLHMGWTAWIGDDPYAVRFLWGLLGNLFLAFGIYWQVASKTIVQPGEGMVLAFSVVLRKSFGTVKVWNDVTLVLLAAVLGFVCLGHVVGVREGTVVSAFLVGFLIKGIAALRTKWGAKSEAKKDGIDSTGAEKTGPQA
jgi:uncharacterized membrane protein YczE